MSENNKNSETEKPTTKGSSYGKPTPNMIRIGGAVQNSLVDGEGIRFAIFTSGCSHGCPGCHNFSLQNPYEGILSDKEELIQALRFHAEFIDGVTLTGGDPLYDIDNTKLILDCIEAVGITDVWLYTGYLFKDIPQEIKDRVNVIIDGKYDMTQPRTKSFRGSDNQILWRKLEGNIWIDSDLIEQELHDEKVREYSNEVEYNGHE